MVFPNLRDICDEAKSAVARDQKTALRLVAIHSGIPALVSLVLTAMNYYLSLQISDTGGLGGLGTRAMLESLQSMLQVLNTAFSLFWSMSYIWIVSRWARGERAKTADLWEGFRHFGPVLRSWLLRFAIYMAVGFVTIQVSSIVFAASPAMDSFNTMFEKIMEDPNYWPGEAELMDFALSYLPFLGVVMLLICVPLSYRMRLMDFALMEQPKAGAFAALRTSLALTRRNCISLFKLDLRFWWYYLLEAAATCLYFGDLLLSLAGVDLGVSPEMMLFIACAVGLLCQTALYIWRRNQVYAAYALVYQRLKPPAE